MVEEKTNLEPVNGDDLNLEDKFGKVEGHVGENESIHKAEKEIPKETASAEKESAYGKILLKVKSQQAQVDDGQVKTDAQTASTNTDAQSHIQNLVDLAMNKGVVHAVKVAKHLEDNYVLDMFHDKLLADELHDALLKKGLINEVK